MNVYIPYTRLPSAYQEVEYIESSGTQIINTGYNITSNMRIVIDFYTPSGTHNNPILGTTYGSWSWTAPMVMNTNDGKLYIATGSGGPYFDGYTTNTKHSLDYNSSSAILDGSTMSISATFNTSYTLTLFYGNSFYGSARIYACQVYTGDTLARNFIPCYRKSDNVIGMYDLVNDQFYTNSGTGTFSKGNDVTMSVLKNIYIGEYTGEPITISGIYWDETQGLISLSSNGSTWITIADKNLGATQVYNYGDTLSESNCGKRYQWGNNYGFSYSGTPSSSTTQLDISSYGPNNYLNSSTFRKIPSGSGSDWRPYTPSNYTAVKNLWGGYTDTLVARRGPCDEGWHIPSYTEANNINTMLLSIFGISSFNSIKTDVITYLKRPAAGTLNGFLTGIDGPGNYLKTMISDYYNGSNSNYYCFEILLPYTSSSFVSINSGSYASTIRPFKNESVQPTSKWTKLK